MERKMEHKTKILIAITLIIIMITAGCVSAANNDVTTKHANVAWVEYIHNDGYYVITLTKVIIPEDDVICFISRAGDSGGISCVNRMV